MQPSNLMGDITVRTWIDAPVEHCFDLARDVGAHVESAAFSGERLVEPGIRTKRGSVAGAMISSRTPARPFFNSKIRLSPLFGMNGKGCAGSIACGVSTGKICSRKC